MVGQSGTSCHLFPLTGTGREQVQIPPLQLTCSPGGRAFIGPEQSRILVSELLDDLVAEYRLGGKQRITREPSPQYLSTIKQVREYFGMMRAAAVRKAHVEEFVSLRQKQGKRNATINRALEMLGAAFRLAVVADPPKVARTLKIRELDESGNVRKGKFSKLEMEQVVASLPAYLADVARFAYETGARSGEILKLRWSYLDGDAICVPSSDTKSRKPRSIALTPELEAIIARRQGARVPGCELIFHHGGQSIKDYRKGWNAACVVNGLGHFYCRTCRDAQGRFISVLDGERRCPRCGAKPANPKYIGKLMHDFRRSAAYELWRGGSTVEECMAVTGHATTAMFKRYADLFTEEEKRARQRETQERRASGARLSRSRICSPCPPPGSENTDRTRTITFPWLPLVYCQPV